MFTSIREFKTLYRLTQYLRQEAQEQAEKDAEIAAMQDHIGPYNPTSIPVQVYA